MKLSLSLVALSACLLVATSARAELPNRSYGADQLGQVVAPDMGASAHNQPSVVNGHLLLAGNATHEIWDISEPAAPVLISTFQSEHHNGEAESHQLAFAKTADGRTLAATITGRGIDLWDLSDVTQPTLLSVVVLEGIDYGDNSNAVWGVFWQGDYIYVGGTNTGLHVVDARDPRAPQIVTRVPTSELGGVSCGPLFAVGNLLVISTPKNHAGVVTVDISDPARPALLDFERPEADSYIGWMFGGRVYLITPLRTYDVTSDPLNITLMSSVEGPRSEYLSFGDGHLFAGSLRPKPGAFKYDISDPMNPREVGFVAGRSDDFLMGLLTDDQFSLPVGNLLVLSDDEVGIGSTLAVHDTARDTRGPEVLYVNPAHGDAALPVSTRVGISFDDQIDLRSIDTQSVQLRPALGGEPLRGTFGHSQTFVSFWPESPLAADTSYELLLPAGGVTDLMGNPLAEELRVVFSTGAEVQTLECEIPTPAPVVAGATQILQAKAAGEGARYAWEFGDGSSADAQTATAIEHSWSAPGRYRLTLRVETEQGQRSCGAIQLVHRPLSEVAPSAASSVAIDAERGRAWVVNPDAGTVAAVSLEGLTRELEVAVGRDPRSLAIDPDAALWVANHGDDTLSVLDVETGALQDTVALRYGAAPYGVAVAPDGARVYATLQGTGELLALDPDSHAVTARLALGGDAGPAPQLRGLAVSADSQEVYLTRFISPDAAGEVYVVDAEALTLEDTIPLLPSEGPDRSDGGRGLPNYLSSIALSPDGAGAVVPSKKDNIARGLTRDGMALSTTNTLRTVVSFIDLAEGVAPLARRVDLDDHNLAFAAAYSPLGDLVFVVSTGSNRVDVLDGYDGTRVGGFSTGLAPQGLAVDPNGRLVVQDFMSRTLSVYDISGLLSGREGTAPLLARVPTQAEEALDETLLLGKQIFFEADSRRMSQDGYISCAGCHLDGADDGRTWDFSDRGEGLRNTTDLRGRAGMAHGPVHWSGNFDEIQDFEHDIRAHFGGRGLLEDSYFFAEGRDTPLGTSKTGGSESLDALAIYVASLDVFPRSPHKAESGGFSPEAERGFQLLIETGCLECHAGQALTDSALGADLRHDVGTLGPGSGGRLGGTLDGIDTPTLRGVWANAPYFHDGSAPDLEAVLAVPEHGRGSALTAADRTALIQFLLELDNDVLMLPEPTPTPAASPEPTAPPKKRGGGGCASATPNALSCSWLAGLASWARRRRRKGQRSQASGLQNRGGDFDPRAHRR